MTITKDLPGSYRNNNFDKNIINLIKEHYFDIIIYGSVHRGLPFIDIIPKYYRKNEIIMVCGEDLHSHCILDNYLGYHRFLREK